MDEPDYKWQNLIDNYLDKLHIWQRLCKGRSGKPPNISKGMVSAYNAMKKAQKELTEYENLMGY